MMSVEKSVTFWKQTLENLFSQVIVCVQIKRHIHGVINFFATFATIRVLFLQP